MNDVLDARTLNMYSKNGLLALVVIQHRGSADMFDEQDFEAETRRISAMRHEELVLYLARQGISPEDQRVSLKRMMRAMRDHQRREILEHLEDLTVEQELGLKR